MAVTIGVEHWPQANLMPFDGSAHTDIHGALPFTRQDYCELGAEGRKSLTDFLVIPQNAPFLLDEDSRRYAAVIDGLAVEDTWFHGNGDAGWNDPGAGDLRDRHKDQWSTNSRLFQYRKFQTLGMKVYSVDYCISTSNARDVYRDARLAGLVLLVTRVALSQLTETPPQDYP